MAGQPARTCTEAERICKGVGGPLRDQIVTLAENVCFLAEKLDAEREVVAKMHPFMQLTVGESNPHKILRPNPAWRGYTDMLRAYSVALRDLRDLMAQAGADKATTGSLYARRKKFRTFDGGLAKGA